MKARKLIQILADRAGRTVHDARRRKVGDYAAIMVGLAIISAMNGSPAFPDDFNLAAMFTSTTPSSIEAPEPQIQEAEQRKALLVEESAPSAPRVEVTAERPIDAAEEVALLTPRMAPKPAETPTPVPAQTAEPARAVASSRSSRPASTPAERFIVDHAAAAQESMRATGVPASVTLAQGILESNSGQSLLSTKANNYFGIKARGKEGPAGVVYMDTWEHIAGKNVSKREPFRAYNSAAESFTDHGQYLRENKRYATAFKYTDDAREFARQIHKAGYATDPNYASKLIKLMDRYDLYEFDQ